MTVILGHTLQEWQPIGITTGPPFPKWLAPKLPFKGDWPWVKAGSSPLTTQEFLDAAANAPAGLSTITVRGVVYNIQSTGGVSAQVHLVNNLGTIAWFQIDLVAFYLNSNTGGITWKAA